MAEKRIQKRRMEDSPEVAVSTSLPPEFAPAQQDAFVRAMELLDMHHLPYAVSGAFALHEHTGIWRNTKDLDLFLPTEKLTLALEVLRQGGFETEIRDPIWLGKAWQNGYFIDLITGMSNAVVQVDEEWIRRARRTNVLGIDAPVLGAEELIASKIFVTRRERFDGADVTHVIYATRDTLDWERVFVLVGDHWEMLLWSLMFFRYIYPRHANELPREVWHRLIDKLENALTNPDMKAPFRGSLIDENMFAIDVEEWGMENEIEKYREQHRSAREKRLRASKEGSAA